MSDESIRAPHPTVKKWIQHKSKKKTHNHNFYFQEVHEYKVPKAGYSLNEKMIEFEKKRSYIEKNKFDPLTFN